MASNTPTTTSTRQRITNFSRRFAAQRSARRNYTAPPNEVYPSAQPTTPPATSTNGPSTTDSSVSPGTALSTDVSDSASSSLSSQYALRAPRLHRKYSSILSSSPHFKLPDLPWLCGTWHVTHSTLPMWRNKRNVRITYTRLPGDKLDDVVTYQVKARSGGEDEGGDVKTIRGVDSPKADGSWLWRGRGALMVASSRWEVLGWGGGKSGKEGRGEEMDGEEGQDVAEKEGEGEQWVVTFFAKTIFTPAGIDIYSRKRKGLSERTLKQLKRALMRADTGGVKKTKGQKKTEFGQLVSQIFEVTIDHARDDVVEN